MEKNEFSIKVDKIKKHYARQNYAAAVKIADEIDFKGVKDWRTIALMINLYEAVSRPQDVRYFCVLAYNRNLGGKKLIYKLTKVCISLGEIDEAEDLYEEYARYTGNDGKKLELRYELRKAQGAGMEELIDILEQLAKTEFDDKYGYILAYLYSKSKQYEKCVETCDQVIENYLDGEYVEKARDLRSFYVGIHKADEKEIPVAQEELGDTRIFRGRNKAAAPQEPLQSASETADRNAAENEPEKVLRVQETESADETDDALVNPAVESARQSVRELIDNAKKTVESTYEEVKKETELQDIKVRVPENSKYDTKSLQDTIAKGVSDCFEEEKPENVFKPELEPEPQTLEQPQETITPNTAQQPEEIFVEDVITVEPELVEVEMAEDETAEEAYFEEKLEERRGLVGEAAIAAEAKHEDKYNTPQAQEKQQVQDTEVQEAMDMVAAALATEVVEENRPSVDDIPTNKITVQKKTYEDVASEDNGNTLIPISVRRYFSKYSNISGVTEQVGDFINQTMEHDNDLKMGTSCTGNLIISGNRSSDKKQLAINVIKALNDLDSDRIRKIAATSGDSINQRGIAKSMGKIAGAALIIEEAGVMERNRVEELLRVMKGDTDEMLVILEDSETEINNLLRNNPELEEYFNHRIVYKQYNVNELVEMCKRYAEKNNFMIDDKAMFLLYEQINAIHGHEEGVNLEEVRAVVDSAIDHAEKRAGRLLFGGVKKKKIDEKEYYILVESDFKG